MNLNIIKRIFMQLIWILWTPVAVIPCADMATQKQTFFMVTRKHFWTNCLIMLGGTQQSTAETSACHYLDHWVSEQPLSYAITISAVSLLCEQIPLTCHIVQLTVLKISLYIYLTKAHVSFNLFCEYTPLPVPSFCPTMILQYKFFLPISLSLTQGEH
jgi:hypothetical protein